MQFTPIPYMTEIRQFLLTYPDLEQIEPLEQQSRDRLVIEYMKTTPQNVINPEGFAMAVVGTNIINKRTTIGGDVTLRKRTNFQFLIKRFTQINEQRRDIGDFILNFCDWINTENELGTNPNLPKFSDTEYEQIIADGGMEIGTDLEPAVGNIDLFVLQLHVEFETVYKRT